MRQSKQRISIRKSNVNKFFSIPAIVFLTIAFVLAGQCPLAIANEKPTFPGKSWEIKSPDEAGLDAAKLDAFRDFVGGRGCIARSGFMVYSWGDQTASSDVASAFKPLLSTLLCFAIQDGKLKSPDEPVSQFEPRLKVINGGKDAAMTWRHLASQTACYGWAEKPGTAWAYNDYALALYYDVLIDKVFQMEDKEVLRHYFAEPLQFEDEYNFEALGPNYRGRLALSVRDFARFALFILHKGRWNDKQILDEKYVAMMLNNIVPPDTPQVGGAEADMIPGQRSVGGIKNITQVGPGYYSYNWWLNKTDREGKRLWPDAPPDVFAASGHGGIRGIWIFPSLDLIVSWNEAQIDDHDDCPGNADSKHNRAFRLLLDAIDKK